MQAMVRVQPTVNASEDIETTYQLAFEQTANKSATSGGEDGPLKIQLNTQDRKHLQGEQGKDIRKSNNSLQIQHSQDQKNRSPQQIQRVGTNPIEQIQQSSTGKQSPVSPTREYQQYSSIQINSEQWKPSIHPPRKPK